MLFFGLVVLAGFGLCALFPQAIAPYGAKAMHAAWLGPCAEHWLGTNDLGYDIFSELIYATRSTLLIGVVSAVVSLFIGTAVGLAAGYLPAWKGELLNGLIQIFLLIPMLPMAIVIAAFVGTQTLQIVLIIALLGWCATARTVRVRTMQLKQTPFVECLLILGISKTQIMLRHILPNLKELVLSRYMMTVARCIMLEATLSFLGMGDPTAVTWGRMIYLAYRRGGFTRGAYHWLISPGLCIALLIIAFYCISQYFAQKQSQVSGSQSYLD